MSEQGASGSSSGGDDQHKPAENVVKEFLGKAMPENQESLELFSVTPLEWCPHLQSGVNPVPDRGVQVNDPCKECHHVGENWLCLSCYEVHCSRYIKEHMVLHGTETGHNMVLSFADLSVWCYACDQYIHNDLLTPVKKAAQKNKFGE